MTPEFFVHALKEHCIGPAVDDCVASFLDPPGRKPPEALLSLSAWFRSLSASDQSMVSNAMRESADAAVFGVLCVVDGARVIESEGEKSQFELTATRGGVRSVVSPGAAFLHDILRGET